MHQPWQILTGAALTLMVSVPAAAQDGNLHNDRIPGVRADLPDAPSALILARLPEARESNSL
ncbi:MAG: hypothetical protein ACRDH2_17050, partial [Anaerolineales bacterium]